MGLGLGFTTRTVVESNGGKKKFLSRGTQSFRNEIYARVQCSGIKLIFAMAVHECADR